MKLAVAIAATFILVFCNSSAYQLDEAKVRNVLIKAMKCQNITQLHSAVVHNDRSLYTFRLRQNLDGSVSDNTYKTLMPIASVSKGMFSSALVRLEEDLKTKDPNFNLFTTPIKKFMGDDFWFLDHQRTDAVTIEDLLSHSTGLNRHDTMTMLGDAITKEDVYRRTGRLKPSLDFRASFIYNNLAYTVADYVVQTITGKNFTSYMREQLWGPLGMEDTRGSTEMGDQQVQVTFANMERSAYRALLDRTLDVSESAGGIFTPLDDIVKYMIYHIRQLNNSNLAPPHKPFMSVNGRWTNMHVFLNKALYADQVTDIPQTHYESYGYGWTRSWYRNNLIFEHGGSYVGARSELEIYPHRALGVFTNTLLGNTQEPFPQAGYATALNKYIADLLLQEKPFVTEDNVCSLFKSAESKLVPVERRQLTSDERDTCTGSFGDFGYGVVKVVRNATSGLLNAYYGLVVLELLPVSYKAPKSTIEFFATVIAPSDLDVQTQVSSVNDTHVIISTTRLTTPSFFISVWKHEGQVYMNSPLFEPSMNLQKGLDPSKWQRPSLCPGDAKDAARTSSARPLLTLAMAFIVSVLNCR